MHIALILVLRTLAALQKIFESDYTSSLHSGSMMNYQMNNVETKHSRET